MGYNTISFHLNDDIHQLSSSPQTVIYMLQNPGFGDEENARLMARRYAKTVDESFPHSIRVLPCFHSSSANFYFAGGNQIKELKVDSFGINKKGNRTVTLILPEWWK